METPGASAQRTRTRNVLIAVALVAVFVVLGVALTASPGGQQTIQSSQTVSEVTGPTRTSIANGVWNFTVTINTNSTAQGQPIQLEATLTNVASTNQTVIQAVSPFIEPSVTTSNGTLLWEWNQPENVTHSTTVAIGASESQDVTIPTSNLKANQTYLIQVVPLDTPTQTDFLLKLTFVVT